MGDIMNNKELLFNRMIREGYEQIRYHSYFHNVRNSLIKQLLNLDSNDFRKYIVFIDNLNRKNLLYLNEEKMYSISELFIFKMKLASTKTLMHLLVTTTLINHPQVFSFAGMILQVTSQDKLDAIKVIIKSEKDLTKLDIVDTLGMLIRVKNKVQLDVLTKILLIKGIRDNRNYARITELVLKNPNNPYLVYVKDAFKNRIFLENNSCVELAGKYLMQAYSEEVSDLIFSILAGDAMIKSSQIREKILKIVSDQKNKMYLPYIQKFIEKKPSLTDESFKDLIDHLFRAKTSLQIEALLSVLNFTSLLENENQLLFILNKCLKIETKFQLDALNKILEKLTSLDNFDFYSEREFSLIDAIVPEKVQESKKGKNKLQDYQALCLANSCQDIIKSKHYLTLIKEILSTSNKIICRYITILLSIPDILNLENFLNILSELFAARYEFQMKVITYILMQEKVIKSNNYLKFIRIINRCDINQVETFRKIIDRVGEEELKDLDFLKILNTILSEKSPSKLSALEEIIVNYQVFGLEKTLEYISQIKDVDKKNYKMLLNTIKSELQTPEEEVVIEEKPEKRELNPFEKIKIYHFGKKIGRK